MGILLPPITQVTTVTSSHLNMHHRNRSLDSALQRIPEVDVTPSPECETGAAKLASEAHGGCTMPSTTAKTQREELASLGSDDSGILCGSDAACAPALASPNNQSRESLDSGMDTCDSGEGNAGAEAKAECLCEDASEPDEVRADSDKDESKPSTGLLRLLESKVFDVSMAVHYLFKSKEPGVQSYIANRMFSFGDSRVDFYLPQLVLMYIQMHDVAEVLHPYLVHR